MEEETVTTDYKVNVRAVVLDILIEVLDKGSFSHLVLRQALAKFGYLEKNDRAFISRLAQGCIARKIELDYRIDQVSSIKTKKMKPVIRNLLRMAVYQIWYMDQVPDHAVCSEAVKLAGKRGFSSLKGFVNGVTRSLIRSKKEDATDLPFCVKYSVPEWMDAYFAEYYDKTTREGIWKACLQESEWSTDKKKGLCVRLNVSKKPEEDILESLHAEGVITNQIRGILHTYHIQGYDTVDGLESFMKGYIQVQDGSSVLAGQAAAPKNGDYCIDVCAAPGGKSIHLADILRESGMVESHDLTIQKVEMIQQNIQRCGFKNISASVADALVDRPEVHEKADVVMADLPCSGLGVIGRKPDIKYQMTKEKMESLVLLQRKILSVVQGYVKPGGILLYSTCTINPEENQENVNWLLHHYPFKLETLSPYMDEEVFGEGIRNGYVQLLPGIYTGTGFFIARLKRI